MKRLLAFLLLVSIATGCLACGRTENNPTEKPSQTESESAEPGTENGGETQLNITDANQILSDVWKLYKEDEKFAAVGGHYGKYTDDAPAKYDLSKVEDLEAAFCIPKEAIGLVDDVATLQHAMNVNNFSAAAYHLKDAQNMQKVIEDIKGMTLNNQWLCGFPERLIMVTIGDEYLVTAFGNGEIVTNFKDKLLGLYDNAPKFVVDEDL